MLATDNLNVSDNRMMGKVELSDLFKNLKMDDNIVDTTKAEEYLAKHTEFRSDDGFIGPETVAFDSHDNKVFCLPYDELQNLYISRLKPIQDEKLPERLDATRKLAQAIGNETDLICQLEYLIRKIPVRETKYSIQLIMQHLTYSADNAVINDEDVILIQNDTPLLALGYLAGSIKSYDSSYLYATNETAVICHLFTELCKNAALECIKLAIGEAKSLLNTVLVVNPYRKWFDDLLPEVTGIITDKSDVDSAVDSFIHSGYHPFPLTRIFVQESIYKEFKNILTWKCKSPPNVNLSLKSNCTDAFKYGKKTFYLDYAGNVEDMENQKDHPIFIEAYRTVNELLSLLNKAPKRLCLSLWASDISEANEIALNVTVPVVWVNDYYNFNGPNMVSQVIFDKTNNTVNIGCDEKIVKQLTQQHNNWIKLNFNERREKVVKAFETVDKKLGEIIKTNKISNWNNSAFVAVEDRTMILGFHLPLPIVSYYWSEFEIDSNISNPKTVSVWLSIVKALVNGSAFAYHIGSAKYDSVGHIFQRLVNFGLPIAKIKVSDTETSNSKIKMVYGHLAQSAKTKVIWTNFGTRFAN